MVLGIALSAFVACGGDDEPAAEPAPDDGSTSSSTSSSSSGDNGPKPGSSSGDPNETVSCEAPSKQGICTIEAFFAYDVELTTDAGCKTSLYVAGKPTPDAPNDFKTRRYTLKTLDPCVFERDTTFPELASSDVIAADEAGNILSVGTKTVELLHGDQRIKCDGTLPEAPTHFAILARDGSAGYLAHYANVNDKVANISFSKVTVTGETCAVAALALTGDPLTGVNSIALDTKGRLHVADTTYPKGADRIAIYDADGKFVSSYKGVDPDAYFSPTSVTPCKGGMCVDGFGAVFSFDENGIMRGHAKLEPQGGSFNTLIRYIGSTRGPFFVVGNNDVEPRHLLINAMVRP